MMLVNWRHIPSVLEEDIILYAVVVARCFDLTLRVYIKK